MNLTKPLMIFDGDCGFCRRWIARWRELTNDGIDYAPYQEVAGRFPEIPLETFTRAVQLVEPGGRRSRGAEAVFRSLSYAPHRAWMLWCYQHVPLAALVTEWAYGLVASHRPSAERVTQLFWGDHLESPTYRISSWLFLRVLALTYLVAFLSLWVQINGLIGRRGIVPLESYLNAIRQYVGLERYWLLPTLSWISSGEIFLHLFCSGGVLLSLLVLFGITPVPCLALLWASYLSLAVDCREFLGFQWDALLLEAGFLAIFLTLDRWRSRFSSAAYSPFFHFLLRWLLFRLMFSSGAVKLASGDPTWRSFTALRYHFETQPLPTWIGWYAHQLPDSVKTGMTAFVFLVELVAPFFMFGPRRLRLGAFALITLLQMAIGLTGNYAFFNLLTVALALLLLDDAAWPRKWRERVSGDKEAKASARLRRRPVPFRVSVGVLVLLLTAVNFCATLKLNIPWPYPLESIYGRIEPFRTFNGYGLFAVMTTTRPEIVVEGSNDGEVWLPYEFKWKPGDIRRRPPFVAPHQPRLDWQMWFAALETYNNNPWFVEFLGRLLEGSPEVLNLLSGNPFPGRPPKLIRASLYRYRFTGFREHSQTGAWWKREYIGTYFPPRSLVER